MRWYVLPFLIVLLFTPFTLFAQESSDWYVGKPIKDIQFKGLEHVSENELRGIVDPYIGKNFTDELFLELQSKLYALDFFELFVPNAKPGDEDYNSIIIEFEVTERPIIEEINIIGNSSLRKPEILDAVLLKKGDMVNKTKVNLDTEAIRDLYLERGFPDVKVDGSIEKDEETNTATVTFTIDEGKQTKIKNIEFSGNSFASDGTLRRVMTTKAQSIFSTGVYQESKIEEDIQKIQLYYWEKGYIDAQVVDVVQTPFEDAKDETTNFINLTLYIEEGEQWTYGGIEFEGNALFTNEELEEVVRLDEGDILDKKKFEADFARINDIYYDNGYIYNVITKEEIRDEENNTVSYVVTIVEKGRAHIENIVIQGNEKTKDFVINRELPVEVGDVFSKKKVMQGLQNLYNTGLFSVVEPTTPMGSVDGLMDLIINVEEGKTIDLNFGVTFSGAAGDFPVMAFLQLKDNNFLGRGLELSSSLQASGLRQKLSVGFTDPWFLGERITLGVDLGVSHQLSQSIKQDILPPVFGEDDDNRVPDPYEGYYVFSEDTTYNGTDYDAGDLFPGIPSEDDIEEYNLETDYDYASDEGDTIPDSYLMEYHSWDFSLGLNTGYRWNTNIGRFSIGASPKVTLKYLTYDDAVYRPYNPTERLNLDRLRPIDDLGLTAAFDTRDFIYKPSKGVYLKQSFNFAGLVFEEANHFLESSSKAEFYLTLLDVPVFENWNFKTVFALSSSFSMILAYPWLDEVDATTQDLLFTESMLIARGWPRQFGGKVLWNNWAELRIPISEQFFWWDFFFNATGFWEDDISIVSENMAIDDFMFSFGGGFRLTIPGLPIGFYFTKRFKISDGEVLWQTGSMFNEDLVEGEGIDFVISFTYELF